MKPTEVISTLQARGVELWQDGGTLRYRAPAGALTERERAALKAHKSALLRALSLPTAIPGSAPVAGPTAVVEPLPSLSPAEQEAFEERAAIMEYDGGLPRQEAEQKAAANRQAMPHVAHVVDAVRAIFGPVRVTYAAEGGHELRTKETRP